VVIILSAKSVLGHRLSAFGLSLILLGGCSNSAPIQQGGQGAAPTPVVGGCGITQLYSGPVPAWLDQVEDHNPPNLAYAIASPPIAAGFFFGSPPLIDHQAMKRTGRGNKAFWSIKGLKQGEKVTMDVYPLGSSVPASHYDLRGPGSYTAAGGTHGDGLDVPAPGCWRFVLSWGSHQAEVDLQAVGSLTS
jgi:hypothetical protein